MLRLSGGSPDLTYHGSYNTNNTHFQSGELRIGSNLWYLKEAYLFTDYSELLLHFFSCSGKYQTKYTISFRFLQVWTLSHVAAVTRDVCLKHSCLDSASRDSVLWVETQESVPTHTKKFYNNFVET